MVFEAEHEEVVRRIDDLDLHVSLRDYLKMAYRFYRKDRLDLAMQVIDDSFQRAGWPAGDWDEFYNTLTCEKDARDSATLHKVDDSLSIELDSQAPMELFRRLWDAAIDARYSIRDSLRVEFRRPVLITVFRPDAPLDFITSSHGYCSHRLNLDKICIPRNAAESARVSGVLMHEFCHVAHHELGGDKVPHWMGEGLAVYVSHELDKPFSGSLEAAAARGRDLLSVDRLEGALSSSKLRMDDHELVLAAYDLAGTLVMWWIEHYGLPSVRRALILLGEGHDIAAAVTRATGLSLRKMEALWRDYMQTIGLRGPA